MEFSRSYSVLSLRVLTQSLNMLKYNSSLVHITNSLYSSNPPKWIKRNPYQPVSLLLLHNRIYWKSCLCCLSLLSQTGFWPHLFNETAQLKVIKDTYCFKKPIVELLSPYFIFNYFPLSFNPFYYSFLKTLFSKWITVSYLTAYTNSVSFSYTRLLKPTVPRSILGPTVFSIYHHFLVSPLRPKTSNTVHVLMTLRLQSLA